MNKPKDVDNTPGKPNPGEEQRDVRVAPLLFNAAALGTAVLACALRGPKLPPLQGD
jgi:hypothetical protein